METLLILLFVLCLAISFLMSGMETGVFALNRLRIRQQMRAGNARAAVLHRYLEQPEDFLWTILVGNTLANVTAASLAVMGLHGWLRDWPVLFGAALVLAAILFYVACEFWPKMLFQLYPTRLCLWLARPFGLIHALLRPLVSLLAWLANNLLLGAGGGLAGHVFGNREELRFVMQESSQGLTTEERAMINRVLDLQNLTVRQVMVPMARVTTVTTDTPVAVVFKLCREHDFSRLPVWRREGSGQRITGLVTLRALLYLPDLDAEKRRAGEFLRPAVYLDHELRLEVALRQMQRAGERLAIVLGPQRNEIGIVSLQDILKVIFGEVSL